MAIKLADGCKAGKEGGEIEVIVAGGDIATRDSGEEGCGAGSSADAWRGELGYERGRGSGTVDIEVGAVRVDIADAVTEAGGQVGDGLGGRAWEEGESE